MSDQRTARALRIAVLRERAESIASQAAQGALDAARHRLGEHECPRDGYADAVDGGQLLGAYAAAAGRAATVLAAEREVADAVSEVARARSAWARSAQRRQALEEASRRIEALRRSERERADQRALDDAAGRRRGRR